MSESNHNLGISLFILHCFFFGIISNLIKILQHSLNIFQIIFFECLFAFVIMLPIILLKYRADLKAQSTLMHIARALLWVLATASFFYSLNFIQIPMAVSISFCVPLFTSILAIIMLKERVHLLRVVALVFGFIGMLVIIQPGTSSFDAASLIVVISSLFWSITDIMIKIMGRKQSPMICTFYFIGFSALLSSPLAYVYWHTPNLIDMSILLVLAFLFAANIYAVSTAYSLADLTVMMPFSFLQLVFASVLSYLLFDELITGPTLIGGLIILSSSSYIAYRERRAHKRIFIRKLGKELV